MGKFIAGGNTFDVLCYEQYNLPYGYSLQISCLTYLYSLTLYHSFFSRHRPSPVVSMG